MSTKRAVLKWDWYQTVLGQKKADVTQIYAERDEKLARRIAKESG